MNRLTYLFGDLAVSASAGAASALLGQAFAAWASAVPAMILGMILGMFFALPLAAVAGIRLGAFEVMIPTMLAGMVGGMAGAMAAGWMAAAGRGVNPGAGALAFTHVADALLRGEVKRHRPR